MKASEFITEGTNVRSYNKSIVDALQAMGFKVDSREKSAGAIKTWLIAPQAIALREIVAALTTKFPGTKLEDWDGDMQEEVRGKGFQIEKVGKAEIFLAVHAGPKADEYAMGLDEDEDIVAGMRTPHTRQARLKTEIEQGTIPVIHNTTYTTEPVYTCGDVEALGWMDKEYTHDFDGEVDGWTRLYSGPKPIRIYTTGGRDRILKTGEILD